MNYFWRLFALFIFSSGISQHLQAQWITRPLPDALFPFDFYQNGTTDQDHFLVTPFKLYAQTTDAGYRPSRPEIIDGNGELVWYSNSTYPNCLDFKYYPSAGIYSYTFGLQGVVKTILLDENLQPIDTLQAINGLADVHDIQRAANGNWLFTLETRDTVDLSGATFYNGTNGQANTIIIGFGVQEVDPNGTVVFEWDSNDHISPTETYLYYGYNTANFDYCHGNALQEDSDAHLLLSFRHLNAVYKIHRTTGSVLWKFGGHSPDFTLTNDNGFSGQHDIRKLSNGNYSLFDNANMAALPKVSRGVEFSLDTVNWTATKVSETIYPDNFFSSAMGNFQTLSDGSKMLGYGLVYRPNPSAALFDAGNNVTGAIAFADSVVTYRAHHKAAGAFSRPYIHCELIDTTWYLSTDSNYPAYYWSTNDTTASIAIHTTGTYQVWVPFGSGMLSSLSLEVTNLTDPCNTLGIESFSPSPSGEKFELYSLLGQKIIFPESNQLYIKVYTSGRTEKCLFLSTENN